MIVKISWEKKIHTHKNYFLIDRSALFSVFKKFKKAAIFLKICIHNNKTAPKYVAKQATL